MYCVTYFEGWYIIFKKGAHEKENQGFFVFDFLTENDNNNEIINSKTEEPVTAEAAPVLKSEKTTVFERVALKQREEVTGFKYTKHIVIAVVSVLFVALFIFAHFLFVHEKNSPAAFCEKIVKSYQTRDTELFLNYCTNLPDVLDNEKNLSEYFNSYLPNNKYTFYQVASDKNKARFVFNVGDKKVGEIVFREKAKKELYGIRGYAVEEFTLEPLTSYVITSYSTYQLLINGEPIPERYIYSKSGINYCFEKCIGEVMTKNIYVIDDLNYIANISALDSDKEEVDIVTKVSVSETEIILNPDKNKEKLNAFIKDYVSKFMYYTVIDDRRPKDLLKLVYPDTDLATYIKDYKNPDLSSMRNQKLKNLTVENLTYYGSGCYVCDVKADYTLDVNKKQTTKKFDAKLFIVMIKGKFYVVDMI